MQPKHNFKSPILLSITKRPTLPHGHFSDGSSKSKLHLVLDVIRSILP